MKTPKINVLIVLISALTIGCNKSELPEEPVQEKPKNGYYITADYRYPTGEYFFNINSEAKPNSIRTDINNPNPVLIRNKTNGNHWYYQFKQIIKSSKTGWAAEKPWLKEWAGPNADIKVETRDDEAPYKILTIGNGSWQTAVPFTSINGVVDIPDANVVYPLKNDISSVNLPLVVTVELWQIAGTDDQNKNAKSKMISTKEVVYNAQNYAFTKAPGSIVRGSGKIDLNTWFDSSVTTVTNGKQIVDFSGSAAIVEGHFLDLSLITSGTLNIKAVKAYDNGTFEITKSYAIAQ